MVELATSDIRSENKCKIEGEDRHCVKLIANQMGRGDKAFLSQEHIFLNG